MISIEQNCTESSYAVALKSKNSSQFDNSLSLAIEVEAEPDFGCYFYTVRSGVKALGIFTRELSSDIFVAKPFYHNPSNVKTQHKSEDEAIAAIIAAYTGKVSFLPMLQPTQVTYHLTLETKEVDEFGIPDEQRVVVKKNAEAQINWHLWVLSYSEIVGEPYRLIEAVRVDDRTPAEF